MDHNAGTVHVTAPFIAPKLLQSVLRYLENRFPSRIYWVSKSDTCVRAIPPLEPAQAFGIAHLTTCLRVDLL